MIWPNNLRVENFAFLDLRGDPMGPKIALGGSYRDLAITLGSKILHFWT